MNQGLDPEPLSYDDACSETGCPYPARWLISDMWGRVPVCRGHLMKLQAGKSLEDRTSPVELTYDSATGRRVVDGFSFGSKPLALPPIFGLRVQSYKVITFGKLILSGRSVRSTIREIGMDWETSKKLMPVLNIPYIYQNERLERRSQRELDKANRLELRREYRERKALARLAKEAKRIRIARTEEERRAAREARRAELARRREALIEINSIAVAEAVARQSREVEERRLRLKAARKYWSHLAPLESGADQVIVPIGEIEKAEQLRTTLRICLGQYRETRDFRWATRRLEGAIQITRTGLWSQRAEVGT